MAKEPSKASVFRYPYAHFVLQGDVFLVANDGATFFFNGQAYEEVGALPGSERDALVKQAAEQKMMEKP